MKRKSLFLRSSVALLAMGTLSGCAGLQNSNEINVWVGNESAYFYTKLAKQFLAENPDFGYKITITGADTASAAQQVINDNNACGDIVTIAHDNIGKLSQLSYIAPIVDNEKNKGLMDQIKNDNPQSFQTVIKNILGSDSTYTYTFGVPYISQALFLYYDTRYVTDEEANSFEGLQQAAKRYDQEHGVTKTKGVAVTGGDGFNFAFPILSRNLTAGNTASLRLYEVGDGSKSDKEVRYDSYAQANEQVAIMKYMQRYYADDNGLFLNHNDNSWNVNIEQHVALSVIGGAWHYNTFKKAVTDGDKVYMGCKVIPQFTLTEADVAGIEQVNYPNDEYLPAELRGKVDPVPTAGTVMRGGSFTDCKCFVINMAKMTSTEKYYKLCDLLKYFSSKDAQNNSFLEALNVPAYNGAEEYIESVKSQIDNSAYLMAKSQTGMNAYGIPQPITSAELNTFYYQAKAPDYYNNCLKNVQNKYTTVNDIRKALFAVEYIWKHGGTPNSYPAAFPADSSKVAQ